MTLPPCPCCRAACGVFVNAQARGKIRYFFNVDGCHMESNHDSVYGIPSHAVRCEDCGKVRRDLRLGEGFVVEVIQ